MFVGLAGLIPILDEDILLKQLSGTGYHTLLVDKSGKEI